MRWLLTGLFLALSINVHADTFVYVSMAPEKKIQIFRLDPADGKLTTVETVDVDGTPASLGTNPNKKYLIASLYNPPALASFAIDAATGKIKQLGKVELGKGHEAAFVGTDRKGKFVISALYGAGKVLVHKLKEDGTIEAPPVESVTTAPTAHAFATDPSNKWVFVPHVAPNAIFQFQLEKDGHLIDAGKAPGGAPKAGPRHLAFHPKLSMAYSSDESGMSITAYRFAQEWGLKPVQTLSTLPEGFQGKGLSTAEVKVHPNGKFVWVSNRGHDSLAGFAIDAAGSLKALGQTPTEKTPRSFSIDPDGKYIFGAGEGSGKLAVFRVNLESGELTRIHTVDVGKSLPWVLAVKLVVKK